jgi:isoleucyl-tRNA synthetase
MNFSEKEEKTLKFWKENNIFKKSIRKDADDFIFFEGPPTANGKAGIHHVLARVFKDIVLRYKVMKGFRVERKAGWDTHGLPVELEVEKELGLKNKKDIEEYGIAEFNKKCRSSVWKYKDYFERVTERIAFWVDMENPYVTYSNDYIETVWWIISKINEKGLIYKGYKVVPFCPRCGTSLSSHEVAQGYKKVKENSVYLRFKVPDWEKTSLVSWTTTPWTLPGNVALAVNSNNEYIIVPDPKKEDWNMVLGLENLKNLLNEGVFSDSYKEKLGNLSNFKTLKGSELVGLSYSPLFKIKELESETSYKVYSADFVTSQEGTGIVHTAVMYGEDDYLLGKEVGLPEFHTVDEEGNFVKEVGKELEGRYVKNEETESTIINYLKNNEILLKERDYEHDYPFCWRCSSPLLYYAKRSWFINMQKVKDQLIENNEKINWYPSHLKEGRFGEWLRDVKDWAFSRERYWGTPLPIWECEECGERKVIGSFKELKSQKFSLNNYYLMRHGYSLRNEKEIASSFPEKEVCPLTEEGKKQALRSAKELKKNKIDLIISSDLQRTKETAEIVSKETGAKIEFDKRIRELDAGDFNGEKVQKIRDYLKDKDLFETEIPGGENYRMVKKRVYSFFKDIEKRYKNKNILIISHRIPLLLMAFSMEGVPDEKFSEFEKENLFETASFKKVEFKKFPYNGEMKIDPHRPFIDEIDFYCPKCGKKMKRTPEVMDCWFDSGSMPFAQSHFPFNKKESSLPRLFPADFISEGIDQTRGWFYTLLSISTLLGLGIPYKNVVSLGHILDENGNKMSKSKGNIVDPLKLIEKYGTDAVRWYSFTINQPGDQKFFKEKDVEDSLKRFVMTFWNCFVFFDTYKKTKEIKSFNSENSLDEWITSKLNQLEKEVTELLENYDIVSSARKIESFVVEDFSQWYVRRSRKRMQKPKTEKEFKEAEGTMGYVLLTLSKITAPFIPFLSEEIYKKLTENKESVHLEDWPKAEESLIDKDLNSIMENARRIVGLALAERSSFGIKVRQPLNSITLKSSKLKGKEQIIEIIKEEINVKELIFDPSSKKEINLDKELTEELKKEGILREVLRSIQVMRKKADFKPEDKISVEYEGNNILEESKDFILKEAKAQSFKKKESNSFDLEKEFNIGGEKLWLGIKKL